MSEEVEINGQNVRVELQGGGYYIYSKEEIKLPEITIQCPECNDREHRMAIFITQNGLYQQEAWRIKSIKCKKCGFSFRLPRCDIKVV